MNNSEVRSGFWSKLRRPILALAPMDDVCDAAFRRIVASCGKPDLLMTEFVSVGGLCSAGREHLLPDLWFDESERPIVAQFFGSEPEKFYQCAQLAKELGFDGIDINMGCPVKNVVSHGCGAALIKEPKLAQEIIAATLSGSDDLPVSVKTRIGFNKIIIEEWVGQLLETKPAAIILHLRTAREMSNVPAHWDEIGRAVELAAGSGTLIIGNGDIKSIEHGKKLAEETGVDGVMLGRAIFGNPWLFDQSRSREDITLEEQLTIIIRHTELYEELFKERKNFVAMRKHLLAYANGFRGAKELRMLLQQVTSAEQVRQIVDKFRISSSAASP